MSRRLRSTMVIVATQYGALGLGCALGLASAYRVSVAWAAVARLLQPGALGGIALLAFFFETIRYRGSSRLRQAHASAAPLCLALFLYAGWFYGGLAGPLLDYSGAESFVLTVHLLLPCLLAIGPLVRAKAWVGVAGAVVFFATVLSIIIINGYSSRSGIGFFSRWIA